MPHIAKLVTVCAINKVPDHLMSFVNFHAQLEGIKYEDSEKVAILQVEGTQSFSVFFVERDLTIEKIEEKLQAQDTELNAEARNLILQYLK
jgi:hypothetical protein